MQTDLAVPDATVAPRWGLPGHLTAAPQYTPPVLMADVDLWFNDKPPAWSPVLRAFITRYTPHLRPFDEPSWPAHLRGPLEWSRNYPAVLWLGYMRPFDPAASRSVRGAEALAARAEYHHMLHQTIRQAQLADPGDPTWLRSLLLEQNLLLRQESDWARRHLWPKMHGAASERCWLWQGATVKGHPVMDYAGAQHVPVHRLLWPLVHPEFPLLPTHRPRRTHGRCSDAMCVNPRHFNMPDEHPRVRLAPDGRTRQGLRGQYPSFRPMWTIDNVRQVNLQSMVVCLNTLPDGSECGTPLSEKDQYYYQTWCAAPPPVFKRRGYCPACYQRSQGRRPIVVEHPPTTREKVHNPTFAEMEEVAKMELWRGPTAGPRPSLPEPEPYDPDHSDI